MSERSDIVSRAYLTIQYVPTAVAEIACLQLRMSRYGRRTEHRNKTKGICAHPIYDCTKNELYPAFELLITATIGPGITVSKHTDDK